MSVVHKLTSLTHDQIKISMNKDEFIRLGVLADHRVSIEPSGLGGTGLFINTDIPIDNHIIARIPSKSAFDIPQLLSFQQKLRECDPKDSEIIKLVLTNCGGINETEVIIDYFFSFMIILLNKPQDSDLPYPISQLEFYLEILSRTFVGTLDDSPDNYDYLLKLEHEKVRKLQHKYNIIIESFKHVDFQVDIPTFDEYYHVNKVIKSRVLEIPHSITENDQDFTVNTTLVPFLDYANHQENNNAFFDVDKSTGDILLKCSVPRGKHEVCIKYSDLNSVQNFVATYGFIPYSRFEEFFEIRVPSNTINEYINEINQTENVPYDLIMKWLEILPTIQFIKTPNKVAINYDFNPIPFWVIFTSKFKYLGWKHRLDEIEINDDDIKFDELSHLQEFIEFQEQNCDVIQGVDKLAIEPNVIIDTDEVSAKAKFNRFIKIIVKHIFIVDNKQLTGQYLQYKNKLYETLLHQDDFVLEYNPVWEDARFYQPVTIYNN